MYASKTSGSRSARRTSLTSSLSRSRIASADTRFLSTAQATIKTGSQPTIRPNAKSCAVSFPPMSLKASSMDRANAKTNQRKDINTGMTPFLRPSRRAFANTVLRATSPSLLSVEPRSWRRLLKRTSRRRCSAPIGGSAVLGVYWFMMHNMYSESRIYEKSEPSGGYSSYFVDTVCISISPPCLKPKIQLAVNHQGAFPRHLYIPIDVR